MLPRLATCFFLAALTARADDPWALVDQEALRGHPESFQLVQSITNQGTDWVLGTSLAGVLNQDLRVALSPEAVSAMERALKGQGWALYAPGGARLGEGKGAPDANRIRALMEATGWQPMKERIRAHLREHPEDGEALDSLLSSLTWELGSSRQPDPGGKGFRFPEALKAELADAMGAMLKVYRQAPINFDSPFQGAFPLLATDPALSTAWNGWREALLERAAADPEEGAYWNWIPTGPELEPFWRQASGLEPVPGAPWPPQAFTQLLEARFEGQPAQLAEETGRAMEALLTPDLEARYGRVHRIRTLYMWAPLRMDALLRTGNLDAAITFAGWVRARCGAPWSAISQVIGERCALQDWEGGLAQWTRKYNLGAKEREALRQALKVPPLAEPPAPRTTPLRLAAIGLRDPLAWGRLQIHRNLKPWGPEELVWTPLGRDEAEALARTRDWPPGPRWVLLRGEEVLDTGTRLTAEALESALRGQGRPRLEALDAFIREHPERLDARRERMAWVRTRLPDPDLEPRFLEDALAGNFPLGRLSFKPKGEAWEKTAAALCTRMSAFLEHWYATSYVWRVYTEWSALAPRAPGPAALLQGTATWPYLRHQPVPGPVPPAITSTVLQVLADQGRHAEIDAWMEEIWGRGLLTWLEVWARAGNVRPVPGGRRSMLDGQMGAIRVWMAHWGKALRTFPDPRRLEDARMRLDAVRQGLGGLLSAPPPR
ncbi:MAG TPA: hypothetical protein VK188_08965 [Holophaga sp.]|nr:hypothetical protein [Holophaga sp.]